MDDWSQLLPELLSHICYWLEVPDVLRFSAVCRNWHTAVFAYKRIGSRTSPWIMVSSGGKNQSSTAAAPRFFSLSEKLRSYSIDRPLSLIGSRCECVGSSHGWLVIFNDKSNLSLLNPITRRQICLPPSSTIRHINPVTRNAEGWITMYTVHPPPPPPPGFTFTRHIHIFNDVFPSLYKKAILLSRPDRADDKDCIVIVIVSWSHRLAYTRLGDHRWSEVDDSEDMPILDIVCHQGQIYTVSDSMDFFGRSRSKDFHLVSWDFNGTSKSKRTVIISGKASPELAGRPRTIKYLVSSLWGDVLLVWVSTDCQPRQPGLAKTESILMEVYKLDLEKRELIQINSLCDHAIFIGENSSICLSSCDFPWLKKNCIYFMLSSSLGFEDGSVGIYDLNSGSVEILLLDDPPSKRDSSPISGPIWFMPSLA